MLIIRITEYRSGNKDWGDVRCCSVSNYASNKVQRCMYILVVCFSYTVLDTVLFQSDLNATCIYINIAIGNTRSSRYIRTRPCLNHVLRWIITMVNDFSDKFNLM